DRITGRIFFRLLGATVPGGVAALAAAGTLAALLPACSPDATPNSSEPPQPPQETTMADKTAIRPFQVNFAEVDVTDLIRRVKMTRWPGRELVSDAASRRIWSTPAAVGPTQGVQLATMQQLIQYWGSDYDWH